MKPTVISDISTVTGVADIVIDDTVLWVTPGRTPDGRFWTLIAAANNRLIGVVVEHYNGKFEALIGSNAAKSAGRTDTAHEAALLVLAALHTANHTDGVK
jgi:hypothetical protein